MNHSAIDNTLIIGDMHISDKYSGRHVDYFRDCLEIMDKIINMVKEHKVSRIIFTGDLFGRTNEKNIKNREALMVIMKQFQLLNELTNGEVYSVRGNHDIGEKLTDFDFYVTLGLIKVIKHLDVGGTIRFHLVNYGEQHNPIDVDPTKYNVAITHSTITVDGHTNWFFRSSDAVELASLENLYGVDYVVGGHIHRPSDQVITTSIRDKEVKLFYLGCPTRPVLEPNIWDDCYAMLFSTDGNNVDSGFISFELRPHTEVFQKVFDDLTEEELNGEDDEDSGIDIKQLSAILDELNNYNLMGETSYKEQIIQMGKLDQEASALALSYIEEVERNFN